MKKTIFAAGLTLLMAGQVLAFPPEGGREKFMKGGPGMMQDWDAKLAHLKKYLNLTPDQVTKLEAVHNKYKVIYLDFKEKLSPLQIAMEREELKKPVNYDQIRSLMVSMGEIRADFKITIMKHFEE